MTTELVKFNTPEKAARCIEALGNRGIGVVTIRYKGTADGYWVHYFTADRKDSRNDRIR